MQFALLTLEYPPQKGGVATYYEGMVEELRRAGHTVEVVEKGLLSRWINPHWFAGIVTVWGLLKKKKFDVLIVGHLLPLGTIAYLFRKRVPYIVATHGMDLAMAANNPRKKYLATKVLQNARLVTANSEYTAGLIRSYGVRDERVVILHPCPQPLATIATVAVEHVRSTLGLNGKQVILSVGRLVLRKGFDTLIDAMPLVLAQHPNAVLVVAGDGKERDMLAAKIAAKNIQGSVRMLGAVDSETLAALYPSADVFAMPCRAIGADVEGFGTVYLEAGLFGVPSIAGNSGGAPEAVLNGKTGMVVEPTPEATAQAIVQLLGHNELREKLGAAAREFAATFNWRANVKKLLNAL